MSGQQWLNSAPSQIPIVNTSDCRARVLIGIILCGLLLVIPAAAITVHHVDITVAENGDAYITGDYSMNWMEQVVVYPAALSLLSVNAPKQAVIHSISPTNVQLTVQNLANVRHTNTSTVYTTPAFSVGDVTQELDKFWFANMVTLDLASGTLTLRFPDGATVEDTDLSSVPAFGHAVAVP